MMIKVVAVVFAIGIAMPWTCFADSLKTPEPQKPKAFVTPPNGTDKTAVTAKYGNPIKIISPIGDPPIERWVYDNFTVYFERSTVIHSVVHHQKPEQTSQN